MAAHLVLPWTHCVFANFERWALSVYHSLRQKTPAILPGSNVNEFVFRVNRRRTRHAAFRSLLGIVVARKPTIYKMPITLEVTP